MSIADVWDGRELQLSFRRGFDENMMQRWYELVAIVEGTVLFEDPDHIVWRLHSSCVNLFTMCNLFTLLLTFGEWPLCLCRPFGS